MLRSRLLILLAVCLPMAAVVYTYDSAGRLIKADYGAAGVVTYTYDSAGHLIARQVQTATPVLNSLNPSSAPAKSPNPVTIALNGSGFAQGATVQWTPPAGTPLPLSTTFVSTSQLQAAIPVSYLSAPGTAEVAVDNPGGSLSGQLPFTITSAPILSIGVSHAGNFKQGQNGAQYTVTISNGGVAATSGTVTMTENLPSGMSLVSMSGTGWSCSVTGGTCTQSAPLAAAASYSTVAVTVNVASNATSPETNQVSVSGGGSASASAGDPTTILVSSVCDVNQDGSFTVSDVQKLIDEALGLAPPANDLNMDGVANVVDVQIVINAVLGLGCSAS